MLKHIKPVFFSQLPRVSIADKYRGYLESGWIVPRVARRVGVHQFTIHRLVQRHQQTHAVADRPRSGRPRVTSDRQDRHIVTSYLRDRFLPSSSTAQQAIGTHGRPISNDTVRRRLRQAMLHSRRPYVGQILTRRHHFNWTQSHRNWRDWQWQNVIFLDESRFCIHMSNGRLRDVVENASEMNVSLNVTAGEARQ